MKNIFKYLSVFAIAGSLGLNVMNVSAADKACEAGETEHIDYVMMLDARIMSDLKNNIESTTAPNLYMQINQADKHNNIKGKAVLDHGSVNITFNGEETATGSQISWTAQDFYKKYYNALKSGSASASNDWTYTSGKETYLMHDKWFACTNESCAEIEAKEPLEDLRNTRAGLLNFLASASDSALSSFITETTLFPSSKFTVPSGFDTSKDDSLRWRIDRTFSSTYPSRAVGRNLNGKHLSVFAPAAYYVKYCVAGGSSTNPSKTKTINYDKNTTDTVGKMPANQTFSTECENISSQRPEREGYTFEGWSKSATASTGDPTYAPGSKYCEEGDITLHAIWKPINGTTPSTPGQITVNYDANGGKNPPRSQTTTTGSCIVISDGKPTLDKNNFLGWSRDPKAKEADPNFNAGQQYCGTEDITLYAVWQPQTGVGAHLIAFTTVAIGAGACLVVAKKKNLFRQI